MTTQKTPDPTTEKGFEVACALLEALAEERGLDWKIAYAAAPNEPHAFRLVRENGKPIRPAQVLGETEEEVRDCTTLAAASKRKRRAK